MDKKIMCDICKKVELSTITSRSCVECGNEVCDDCYDCISRICYDCKYGVTECEKCEQKSEKECRWCRRNRYEEI